MLQHVIPFIKIVIYSTYRGTSTAAYLSCSSDCLPLILYIVTLACSQRLITTMALLAYSQYEDWLN